MSTPKITAWSFSRWQRYEGCPAAAKYAFIDKLPEPKGEALTRGTELHLLCEHYLRGIKKTVPKELKLIEPQLKDLRKRGALAEAEFAFNRQWLPVSWFAKDAWVRIKADVTLPPVVDAKVPSVEIHDFKSGKVKEGASEYMLQLELYALAGLLTYETAKEARTSLLFIDHGKVIPHTDTFTPKDIKVLKKAWETRTKRMLNDTQFKPTPGNACRWCHFSKTKGGPCRF